MKKNTLYKITFIEFLCDVSPYEASTGRCILTEIALVCLFDPVSVFVFLDTQGCIIALVTFMFFICLLIKPASEDAYSHKLHLFVSLIQ